MSAQDFLVEIGTEELPPKALLALSTAFRDEIVAGLAGSSLSHGEVQAFATPRRLAVRVRAVPTTQPDRVLERFGPAVSAAFGADGTPTPAALGFARSCGVDVNALDRTLKDGVEKLSFRTRQAGAPTAALLPGFVNTALARLPIPKRMRWGSLRVEFVRPVHWVLMLFGDSVVPGEVMGLTTDRMTRGHRFHHGDLFSITHPDTYEQQLLETGSVIADFATRRERIREQVLAEGVRLNAKVDIDPALLDEVTSLVEWPVALTGGFDTDFLALPPEALISSMKAHQKCFSVARSDGRLLPHFITVSNLRSKDPAQVIAGNEKVIRPRLADARFFYETDRKTPLADLRPQLQQVVFQQQLGTLFDKSERVAALAAVIGPRIAADAEHCIRAAQLAKCDLLTRMVGEFAELQGIMGRYYASHDNEPTSVADALYEQYLPRFAGDELPASPVGCALAIAEKLDTIVGLFAIGQPPTGSKDPFALRRAAIGVLRILVEREQDLDLLAALHQAVSGYAALKPAPELAVTVFDFMLERFRAWYQDSGVPAEVFQAVFAVRPSRPLDFHRRIMAVHHFSQLAESQALSSANKRVSNILAKLTTAIPDERIDSARLPAGAERDLAHLLESQAAVVEPLFQQGDYREGLEQLARCKAVVDRFFDEVLVMDEDPAVRQRRLALLSRLRSLFLQVADISHLHHG